MSSSVSPRQRDIGEVASLRAEGVDRQPRSGFSASLQSCDVNSYEPLRLRHLPYPRYRAAEEDKIPLKICWPFFAPCLYAYLNKSASGRKKRPNAHRTSAENRTRIKSLGNFYSIR